ncbi:DUF4232 domain-containing protein [Actinosynnema sp. NPDC047251]|uniref:Putative secreted protein n=1 Tax=Saccharothrix espanaensis (strain ATCC 51144 / DSM 44229 / JCM 9112 / NBRC 15066 / NRRL 15764) TaxID=1179773 RepID=K0JNW3_SACES|nr:DUF4232 domain-containing protein [Saccharothrix espanaensis]CCH27885.1 putative secreted protein [Saccharothrix espanaensis DSM 44229]
MKRMVVIAAIGAALLCTTGTATAQGDVRTQGESVPVATCTSVDLEIAVVREEPAAGTLYREVRFTNRGIATCVLQGFPGVSYVDSSGNQVGAAATRDGVRGPSVTLPHGAGAVAVVGSANADNFDPAVCRKTLVWGLKLFPPDQTAPLYLRLDGQYGCAGDVSPWGSHLKVTSVS